MGRKHRVKGSGSLFRAAPKAPWIASWYDHDGKRRQRSTRTTDRAAAERILAKHVADTALRRDGVIDSKADRFAEEGRKPLTVHVAAYIAHCWHAGHAPHHVNQKESQLAAIVEGTRATRLGDLTADALEGHLAGMKERGLSARSLNFTRQIAVAFMAWCLRTGRVDHNALRTVPKQDESRDRRRVRRPLTDDELTRLLSVARDRGREAWYLAAALAGLRKGDLHRLTWADVDFTENTLTVRHGKAKRIDVIPMHPQLAEALHERRQRFPGVPSARVWSDVVTDRTRLKDFLRAGIATVVPVLDTEGNAVVVDGKPKVRISVEDEDGRVIDLHALRTTLGTRLARAGVTPQVAQRIMRHSDYRTTLKHYTVLGLTDTAAAMDRLPGVDAPSDASRATGTADAAPTDPKRLSKHLGSDSVRSSAPARVHEGASPKQPRNEKPRHFPGFSRDSSDDSAKRAKGLEPSTFSLEG